MKSIPFSDYYPDFKIEFLKLKEKIYKEANPKKFNGKKLNGPTLVNLIREIVKAINSGAVPNISNAWDNVMKKDIEDYYEKSLNNYKYSLGNKVNKVLDSDELIKTFYVKTIIKTIGFKT